MPETLQFKFSHTPEPSLNREELIQRSYLNELALFETLLCLPGSRFFQRQDWRGVITGRKLFMFNPLFAPLKPTTHSPELYTEIIAEYKQAAVPFFIKAGADDSQLLEFLRETCPQPAIPSTLIGYDAKAVPPFQSDSLQIRLVNDGPTWTDWISVFLAAFTDLGPSAAYFVEWTNAYGASLRKPFLSFVGYAPYGEGGQRVPVTVGSMMIAYGVAGFYNIGTDPRYQKNQFASLMLHYLGSVCAANGIRYLCGSGSSVGMNLYRKHSIQDLGPVYRFVY